MKKYVTIALFIFWAIVVAILVAGLVFYQNRAGRGNPAIGASQVDSVKQSLSGLTLSAAEVAKHSTADDCWMILNGKIYDFTTYETIHPGGMREIVRACGGDGTTLFQTKDNRGSDHSAYAYSLLADYYLGDLGQVMVAAGGNSATTSAAENSASAGQDAPTLPVAETKTQTKTAAAVFLSAAEVAKHDRAADCYLVISGKVYDFTGYLSSHPGGAAVITQACGADGTSLYDTKGGGGGNHSSYADSLLAGYLVGTLGGQTTTTQIQQAQQQGASTSQNQPQGGREEEDDD